MFSSLGNLKLSNKFCLGLFFILSMTAHADCSIEERDGGKTLYLQQGSKKIAILGWKHPTETEKLRTAVGLTNVIKSNAKECEGVANKVKAVLVQQKDLNDSTIELTQRLKQVPFLKTATLGIEGSQASTKNTPPIPTDAIALSYATEIYDLFDQLGKTCPAHKDDFRTFMLSALTPANAVVIETKRGSDSNVTMKIKGMDDPKLLHQYFESTDHQTRTFNFGTQPYTQETKERIGELLAKVHTSLEVPSDEAIQNVIDTIQDPILKGKTLSALRAKQITTKISRDRNPKIIANILNTPGDVVLPIDESHLPGLKSEFQKSCSTSISAEATNEQSPPEAKR